MVRGGGPIKEPIFPKMKIIQLINLAMNGEVTKSVSGSEKWSNGRKFWINTGILIFFFQPSSLLRKKKMQYNCINLNGLFVRNCYFLFVVIKWRITFNSFYCLNGNGLGIGFHCARHYLAEQNIEEYRIIFIMGDTGTNDREFYKV